MRDAITYYYYKPDEMEYLTNVLSYISYKHNVSLSRVRDCLNSCIRPFNNTSFSDKNEVYNALYSNGDSLSLKDFLERIVYYLIRIKKKGRLF